MNKSNVWSLADVGDAAGLERAIQHAPSCINVAGWSYAGGRRRGIARVESDGKWTTATVDAHPATVLHFAAVRGDVASTLVALRAGASVHVLFRCSSDRAVTAEQLATDNGHAEVAELIRSEGHRQDDVFGTLLDNEEAARRLIAAEEAVQCAAISGPFADGVVEVELVLRDASTTIRKSMSVPRYVSFRTFRAKVEEVFGQRVLLSFKTRHSDGEDLSRDTSTLTAASAHSAPASQTSKLTELHAKTIGAFLQRRQPVCIARPLIPCATPLHLIEEATLALFPPLTPPIKPQQEPSHQRDTDGKPSKSASPEVSPQRTGVKASSTSVTDLHNSVSAKQRELTALVDQLAAVERGPTRLATMKRILDDADRPSQPVFAALHTSQPRSRALTPEALDATLTRLYQRPLAKIREDHAAFDAACREGQERLFHNSHRPPRALSPHQEEAVEKLYRQDLERQRAALARAEESVMERVPRAKSSTLDQDEAEAARRRLFANAALKQESIKKLDAQVYGKYEERKTVRDLAAHLNSVYTTAVQKKLDARERIEAAAGDFRRRKPPGKKLTKQQIEEMGKRLASKN